MAVVTYNADVTNPSPLNAGDTPTVSAGVTVTIQNVGNDVSAANAWSFSGSGNMTIDGNLVIKNSSTVNGIRVKLSASTNTIAGSGGRGLLSVSGSWIVIGSGSGLALTLSGALDNVTTTIPVNESLATATPTGQLVIGSEIIYYTGISGNSFTGCVRGAGATTAASYSNGTAVSQSQAGQTAQFWDGGGDYLACVWVETASGSGVYEKYQNLSSGYNTAHATVFTTVGAGRFGKFFSQGIGTVATTTGQPGVTGTNTQFTKLTAGQTINIGNGTNHVPYVIQTITDDTHLTLTANVVLGASGAPYETPVIWFNNGQNGKCPPLGARIRVPNIAFSHNGDSASTPPSIGGTKLNVTMDTCVMTKVQVAMSTGGRSVDIRRAAMPGNQKWGACFNYYFEDVGFGNWTLDNSSTSAINLSNGSSRGFNFVNCCAWGGANQSCVKLVAATGITFTNCEFFQLDTSTSDNNITFTADSACSNITIDGGLYVGQIQLQGGSFVAKNFDYAENAFLVEDNTALTKAVFNIQGVSGLISNVHIVPGGGPPGAFITLTSNTWAVTVQNCNFETGRMNYPLTAGNPYVAYGWRWYNNTVWTWRAGWSSGASGQYYDLVMQNFKTTTGYPGSIDQLFLAGNYISMKGVGSNTASPISVSTRDIISMEQYTSSTTGKLSLYCATPTSLTSMWVTTSGSGKAVFDGTGRCYLPVAGDSVTIEVDHSIYGISALNSATLTNNGSITSEYAIDTGSGYGAWTPLDAAHLSAETVSASGSFKFKARFTNTSSSTTAYASTAVIATTVDQTVAYPLTFATLLLTGLQTGSRVEVYRSSDGVELANTLNSGNTFSYTYAYISDVQIDLVVMSLQYQYVRIPGLTLSSGGLTVPIQQQLDRQYNNPP